MMKMMIVVRQPPPPNFQAVAPARHPRKGPSMKFFLLRLLQPSTGTEAIRYVVSEQSPPLHLYRTTSDGISVGSNPGANSPIAGVGFAIGAIQEPRWNIVLTGPGSCTQP